MMWVATTMVPIWLFRALLDRNGRCVVYSRDQAKHRFVKRATFS
jgi:hypothetical protein